MSGNAAELRDMTVGDIESILPIERASFDSPWQVSGFQAVLRDGSRARVAVAESGLAGYCITHQVLDEAEIYNIAVAETCRGQGLGRKLLRDALEHAARNGVLRMFLEVRVSNAPARSLYASEGFREIGMRKGYYHRADGTREDAVVMERSFAE